MRDWVKWILFLNSYTPFFVILLIRDFQAPNAWPPQGSPSYLHAVWNLFGMPAFSWAAIGILLVSNFILLLFLKGFCLAEVALPSFQSATSKVGESLNYILTYIIPFLELDARKDAVPLLILLAVIGVIYVSSNLLAVNPMLSLAGYRIYQLSSPGDEPVLLLTRKSRRQIAAGMKVVMMTDDIFLEVKR